MAGGYKEERRAGAQGIRTGFFGLRPQNNSVALRMTEKKKAVTVCPEGVL